MSKFPVRIDTRRIGEALKAQKQADQVLEDIAKKCFNWKVVIKQIERAASVGFHFVTIEQPIAVSLFDTKAAETLMVKLEKQEFSCEGQRMQIEPEPLQEAQNKHRGIEKIITNPTGETQTVQFLKVSFGNRGKMG